MTEKKNWRTPAVVVACGGLAMTIVLGTRHGFGLYLQPMTLDLGISRETFSFAIALQNLIYGFSQPLTGMIADKFGAARVMAFGTIAYAIGLVLMSHSTTGTELNLSAGLVIGMAMSSAITLYLAQFYLNLTAYEDRLILYMLFVVLTVVVTIAYILSKKDFTYYLSPFVTVTASNYLQIAPIRVVKNF